MSNYEPKNSTNDDSSEIVFSLCKDNINMQIQQLSSLESKATSLIVFSGVILAILVSGIDTIEGFTLFPKVVIIIGVFLVIGSIIPATLVVTVSRFEFSPDLGVLLKRHISRESEHTKLELIKSYVDSWEKNNLNLEVKARRLQLTYIIQSIGLFILVVALIIVLF